MATVKNSKNGSLVLSGNASKNGAAEVSAFYTARKLSEKIKERDSAHTENPLPPDVLNKIFFKSPDNMSELPDESVHLVVTSPPLKAMLEENENLTLAEYLNFLRPVWAEVNRVLVPGGRICVHVSNYGKKPYIPVHLFVAKDLMDMGFLMRGEIIWHKLDSEKDQTSWGSWRSPSNPVLRETHDYVLVFSKDSYGRKPTQNRNGHLSAEEFLEYTQSVWHIPDVPPRNTGHKHNVHIKLPQRLIKLYSYEGETVLDPFLGSGQTALAALQTGRNFVGYETDKKYVRLAERRINQLLKEQLQVA
jgi:site-specific DNA-methyltransferase (adenine-specific)